MTTPNQGMKMHAIQYKDLLINFTTEFDRVWNDRGTRAEQPVTFWRPSTSSDTLGNFISLGDVAVAGYHNINQLKIAVVVSEADRENGTALRAPADFERVWAHSGLRLRIDFSVWRPIAPQGYVAMGLVCGVGNDKPLRNTIRCVREDLVVPAHINQLIWKDKGSGARQDFSAWGISAPQAIAGQACLAPGTFTGTASYTRPTDQQAVHALRLELTLHRQDLPPLPAFINTLEPQPLSEIEGTHVCELPWFMVRDPGLTPIEQLHTCPIYRLQRNDRYTLVASGQNTTPASKTFNWVVTKGEIGDNSVALHSVTGIDIETDWTTGHPLSASAALARDFTHTTLSAKDWGRTTLLDVLAYIPGHQSVGAYLIRSQYQLLRADGSQLAPSLTYANGNNVYFSEFLQSQAAVPGGAVTEQPPEPISETVPEEVPTLSENTLEITPHDGIDDTLLP
ncbi:Vps62-related protein [Pseudomonas yamanorum]|jgi:hypothetical protein|uniref:Vps62-related protein n=2 Tax=Pseudomonas yamanorum TaxID=515393 RepID=UPI003B9F60E0